MMNKKIKAVFIICGLIGIMFLCTNFIMFPETYLTTYKYQLENKIKQGDATAIDYYLHRYLNNGKTLFDDLDLKIKEQETEKQQELIEEQEQLQIVEEVTPKYRSLGTFKLTAYCNENYPHICNNGDASRTATGTVPTAGRTIAVDHKVIPLGSHVVIDEHEYIAEDTGGGIRGNRIDIVFDSHRAALNFGIQYKEVFIIE